jgi:hypothetical protein
MNDKSVNEIILVCQLRLVETRLSTYAFVVKSFDDDGVIDAQPLTNVFFPKNDCDDVETIPAPVADAGLTLNLCVVYEYTTGLSGIIVYVNAVCSFSVKFTGGYTTLIIYFY